jgi:hypothetical protein
VKTLNIVTAAKARAKQMLDSDKLRKADYEKICRKADKILGE